MENIQMIDVEKLRPFENHPYKVKDDEEMKNLTDSIKEHGIYSPLIVRPINDEFEIISGHRRLYASIRAGLSEVPAIIYDIDIDNATIALVDSNLHREKMLPSEKAFAYKMKMEALNRQGRRLDLTLSQVGKRINSYEDIAEESGESRNQIHRYIRLTNLIPKLLKYVDEGRIAFTPAVELSYLKEDEQFNLLDIIKSEDCTPSLSQAIRLKKLSQNNTLSTDEIFEIMSEEKANQVERIKIPTEHVKKYFPQNYSNLQIEDAILKLCENHYKKKQQQYER